MRLIYFHQYFSTPSGAAGTRSYEMAKRLIARGHEVLMVCGSAGRANTGLDSAFVDGARRGIYEKIEILELDLEYSNSDSFLRRTVAFVRFALRGIKVALKEDYDVIFATSTPLTAGIPGIFARCLRGKRFVFEVRDLWPELPKAMGVIKHPVVLAAMSLLERVSYRSATRIIGLSPGIVEGIAKCGVDSARIALVPNGCDLDIFAAGAVPWRPEGTDHSDFIALFAGAHGIANGLDAVLDAAIELKRRAETSIKIVLVGDGKLKPMLQARARDEALGNVIFLEPISKRRLAGLMAATNIGLQILDNVPAFYYGTSPNKFFDYIAAGLPVLVNYPGWLTDVVRDNDCGYAVPPGDPIAFADALVQASLAPSALKEMGARSHALAEGQFNRRALADQFVDVIEGVNRL
jgi:glycosyltransferase involved in cell wall biosynthesis